MRARRVLISGAGIAGPTLAWFLAKTGARVTVVEKSESLLAQGQNVDIQGSARAVIQKMGLTEQVRRFNTTEKGTQFIDSTGKAIAKFPVNEGSSVSFTSEFEILRGDLAAVLYDATKDLSNVNYLFATTITRVVANGDDAVKVELSDGEVRDFDLVVAADGQWSKVRKQCFPPNSIDVVDMGMYAVYWTVPRIGTDNDWWNIYLALKSRVISLRPDPHGTVRAMFSHMPGDDEKKKAWLAASRGNRNEQAALLRQEFSDAGWQAERLLKSVPQAPDFYFQAVRQIRMSKWSKGSVVCVGDAAYAPTPLTGMGTSLALIGAYVLAGEISKLEANERPAKALEAFENNFRPFVEKTQKIPFFVPAIAHHDRAWKRWLFQTSAKAVAKVVALPWLANRFDQGKSEDFPLGDYPRLGD